MVGLYYKRREERSERGFLHTAGKWIAVSAAIFIVLFSAVIFLFSGERIKDPLQSYLSEKLGTEVNIGNVEFSPIYPDVIRLSDITFGNSFVNELYLDYQPLSALLDNELIINDLYIRSMKLTPEEAGRMGSDLLGFKSVKASLIRLNRIGFYSSYLSSEDLTLRLKEVSAVAGGNISYDTGLLEAAEAELYGTSVKNLSLSFMSDGNNLLLDSFSLVYSGGTVTGCGVFMPEENSEGESEDSLSKGTLDLREVSLSKVILYPHKPLIGNIKVYAELVNFSDVVVTRDDVSSAYNPSVTIQNLNGSAADVKYEDNLKQAFFSGTAEEISFPALQINLLSNAVRFDLTYDKIICNMQGSFNEGKYAVDSSFDRLNNELFINSFRLKNNKLELTENILSFLKNTAEQNEIYAENISVMNAEVLSYINSLPFSVQSISGRANNLCINSDVFDTVPSITDTDLVAFAAEKQGPLLRISTDTPGAGGFIVDMTNFLWQDLRIRHIKARGEVSGNNLKLILPEVFFRESSLSAMMSITNSYGRGNFMMNIDGKHFETADFNSEFVGRLFTGYTDMKIALSSEYSRLADLKANLKGSITAEADSLLVSDFCLDLINGGNERSFTLDHSEILSAISGKAAGISDLKAEISVENGVFTEKSDMKLATCTLTYEGSSDLVSESTSGRALFTSIAGDSITEVIVSGNIKDPVFEVKPLKRGIVRPGMYLPQYSESTENTDPQDELYEDVMKLVKNVPVSSAEKGHKETNTAAGNTGESKIKERNGNDTVDNSENGNADAKVNSDTVADNESKPANTEESFETEENTADKIEEVSAETKDEAAADSTRLESTETDNAADSATATDTTGNTPVPNKTSSGTAKEVSSETKDTVNADNTPAHDTEAAAVSATDMTGESPVTEANAEEVSTETEDKVSADNTGNKSSAPETEAATDSEAAAGGATETTGAGPVTEANAEEISAETEDKASADNTPDEGSDPDTNAAADSEAAAGTATDTTGESPVTDDNAEEISAETEDKAAADNTGNKSSAPETEAATDSEAAAGGATETTGAGPVTEANAEEVSTETEDKVSADNIRDESSDSETEAAAGAATDTTGESPVTEDNAEEISAETEDKTYAENTRDESSDSETETAADSEATAGTATDMTGATPVNAENTAAKNEEIRQKSGGTVSSGDNVNAFADKETDKKDTGAKTPKLDLFGEKQLKQADELEEQLLKEAVIDSFFNFNSYTEPKDEDFSFGNNDDELIF